MKTVGLTGGIASGKSTVAGLLRERGIPVIDADQVSRQVVAPGSEGLAAVVTAFGPGVLAADGSLDRKALGAIVVADADARRRLEAITHPRIGAAVQVLLDALDGGGHPVAVVEAALMVETGSFRRHDAVLLVGCSPAAQVDRLAAREGWDRARAAQWLDAQPRLEQRRQLLRRAEQDGGPAVVELDNDGAPDALERQLDRAWPDLLRRLGVV